MQLVNISYGLLLHSFTELTDLNSNDTADLIEIQHARHRLIFLGYARLIFSIRQDTIRIL
jgi:hypothetical protein